MFYMVITKFHAGIYLSKVGVQKRFGGKNAQIISIESFEKASEMLKALEEPAHYAIPWDNFQVNRLYKLYDDRKYLVVYTKKVVAFVTEKQYLYVTKKMASSSNDVKISRRMTYLQAVQKVVNMGAVIPGNAIVKADVPKSGHIYRRRY